MLFLDDTLPTHEENLACDEAILDMCEETEDELEILRLWESSSHFVVVGYSDPVSSEVRLDACRARGIPVLRRCSGGGAVLQGPGCLNYSLILRIPASGPLTTITGATRSVLQRHRTVLESLTSGTVEIRGHSDIVLNGLKVSGNAQRRRQRCLMIHGTFLTGLDLSLVEELLPIPTRQPDYRHGQPHRRFMANMAVSADLIRKAVREEWNASDKLPTTPLLRIDRLVQQRYALPEWNFRR